MIAESGVIAKDEARIAWVFGACWNALKRQGTRPPLGSACFTQWSERLSSRLSLEVNRALQLIVITRGVVCLVAFIL